MRTIFFQSRSLRHVLLTLGLIRQANHLVFHCSRPFGEPGPLGRRDKIVEWLIRWVNPAADITVLDRESLYGMGFYANNAESNRWVDAAFESVRHAPSIALMRGIIDSPAIDLFYKRRLLDPVRDRTLFYRAAKQVLGSERDGIAVPSERDIFQLDHAYLADFRPRAPVPVRVWQWVGDWAARTVRTVVLWNPVVLALLPLAYAAWLVLRRGIRHGGPQLHTDVIAPLIQGFTEDGLVRGKKRLDDSELLGGELGPHRVAFYFSDWPFSEEEARTQRQIMERRGIRHFDVRALAPSFAYLREVIRLWIRLCSGLIRRPAIIWEDWRAVRLSAALLYRYLRERLVARAVDFKVSMECQDYLSAHVVRTIVANQAGRLTVGMHHNAPDGPYGFPELRYVHINRYCLWGEEFKRLYEPHWDHLQTCAVGPPRIDDVLDALHGERRGHCDQLYRSMCGGVRPLVVILFPAFLSVHVKGRVVEQIEGLRRLRNLPGLFQIVCRFRTAKDIETFSDLGLAQIIGADDRITVDMTNLTTYEWLALADIVIVPSISTGMIEAAAADKPCFSFDHLMLADRVYGRYGSDLILRTADDLIRVVRHAAVGFHGWDCRWDQLVTDYCYFTDGKNRDRFRWVILDAVEAARRTSIQEAVSA